MTHKHIPFSRWTNEGDDAVLRYRGHHLAIRYNQTSGHMDGYIDTVEADMHCQGTYIGLSSLARMLQLAVDKRIDDTSYKYGVGTRVLSALCADGRVRGNGVIEMRRFIADGKHPDPEPAYMVCFAGEHHHVTESAIKA